MWRLAFVCAAFCFRASCCWATVSYDFNGQTTYVSSDHPYSTIPNPAAVTGAFRYNPLSPATNSIPNCNCVGYRQRLTNGFRATFGDLPVRADDYLVIIGDDLNDRGMIKDVVTISFDSSSNPAPEKPLLVNGIPQSSGMFNLVLYARSNTLFTSTSLPSSLNPDDFGLGKILVSAPQTPFPNIIADETGFYPGPTAQGDYNFNEIVGTSDYLQWRDTFGSTSDLAADGNQNGVVDASDYVIWRHIVHDNVGAKVNEAVPEPNASILIGCLATLLGGLSRIRK